MVNGIDMHSFISISFHISFAVYHKNEIIVHLSMNVQIYSFSFCMDQYFMFLREGLYKLTHVQQ